MINVQVVCALRERQVLRALQVDESCTVAEAVAQSAVLDEFPQLDVGGLRFAVFGVRTESSQRLSDGDRVEVLRGLVVDPREGRRRRAALRAKKKKPATT